MNICKLMGVSAHQHKHTLLEQQPEHSTVYAVSDVTDIKNNITRLLSDGYNSVLVNYNNELFVCQSSGDTYIKRRINYHPLQQCVSN